MAKPIDNSLSFLPENLQNFELYPKVTEMIDYIISQSVEDLKDIKYKFRDSTQLGEDQIKEIIEELGFGYIRDVMDTISNFEFNILLDFVALINLMKGSRQGLELILRLLGFDSVITEWWEREPQDVPHTYEITVIMNTTFITDVFATLEKVQEFSLHYVFPLISNIDFRFSLSFAEKNVNFGGFWKHYDYGTVRKRVPGL